MAGPVEQRHWHPKRRSIQEFRKPYDKVTKNTSNRLGDNYGKPDSRSRVWRRDHFRKDIKCVESIVSTRRICIYGLGKQW